MLAATITGNEGPTYAGTVPAAKLKIMGVDVFSAGDWSERGRRAGALRRPRARHLQEAAVRDGKLAGVILVGDTSDSHRYMDWLRTGADLTDQRRHLLFPAARGRRGPRRGRDGGQRHRLRLRGRHQGRDHPRHPRAGRQHDVAAEGVHARQHRLRQLHARCARTCCAPWRRSSKRDARRCSARCVPFAEDKLREILRSQQLKSVQEVLDIYGNGKGCEVCKPALSYMLDMLWCGDHDEDRSARFINDRVHANIQKDGTFSVIPRMRGGVTSPDELRRIADVADKYHVPMVKITGSQRIDLLGVKKADLPTVWADLGMPSGQAYTKGVRMVKTCVGTEFCRFGTQDSIAAGIELERRFENLFTPHKVKMAVVGCPRNCAEATVKDIGLVGRKAAGRWWSAARRASRVRKADLLITVETTEQALEAAELFFQYYRENANYLERTYDFVERLGHREGPQGHGVRAGGRAAGAARPVPQVEGARAATPGSKAQTPVHPTQFMPLQPVDKVLT